MMKGDMKLRREKAINKVHKAITDHGGTTLMAAGLAAVVPGITGIAAFRAGARLFEISQNGVALDLGLGGIQSREEARKISYEIPIETMAAKVKGFRNVLGEEAFITVGFPGIWSHWAPVEFTDHEAKLISLAGTDGLHVHKTTVEDHADIAVIAHKYGMLIEGYITGEKPDSLKAFPDGVPAKNLKDVERLTSELQDAGVDLIGLITGQTYLGHKSEGPTEEQIERLKVMINAAKVPTMVHSGVTPLNVVNYKELGVDIVVVGTAFDEVAQSAIDKAVKSILKPHSII